MRGLKVLAGVSMLAMSVTATAQTVGQTQSPEPPATSVPEAPPATGDDNALSQGLGGQEAATRSPADQATPNAAPDAGGLASGDIVVTATRRAQNLRDIPASISAIGSAALQQRAISNIVDLNATVPGLQISPNNTDVTVTIRGVGHALFSPSAENSVALHLDGVYLSRPSAALSAFFDVERVEVLRGPQGSLYGRNATGGAINIISVAPSAETSGFASISVGNYKRLFLETAIGGPIAGEAVTARVGGYVHRRFDGFGKNLVNGADVDDLEEYGGKAAVTFRPTEKFDFTVRGDYYHADDRLGGYHFFGSVRQPFPGARTLAEILGGRPSPNVRDVNYDTDNARKLDIWGVSGEANWELSDTFALKSLSGYRRTKSYYQTDLDGTPLPVFSPFFVRSNADQFSQELQLSFKFDRLVGLVGAYYFEEKVDSTINIISYLASGLPTLGIPRILPAPFGVFDQQATVKTKAYAAFANVDWSFTDQLTLGLGLRYTNEKKSNEGFNIRFFPQFAEFPGRGFVAVDDSRKSDAITPKVSLRYAISDTFNVYASATRGFKSGEFISGNPDYARPEYVWAYEAGIKGGLFDRQLNFSLAGFYYDYTDLQLQRVQTPLVFLENAPGGTLKGIEGEASVRLPAGFAIDGNFTYLDTKVKGFITEDPNFPGTPSRDLTGNRFAFAPKFTYNVGGEKRIDFGDAGVGVARVDFQHTSGTFLDIFSSRAAGYRRPYGILNASYRHTLGNGLSLLFFGKNLTNRTVKLFENINAIPNLIVRDPRGVPVPVAGTSQGTLNDPRTYGATLRWDF